VPHKKIRRYETMGQYYALACPQHRSHVEGYPLGAGAKGAEHVWGQFIHSALGVLCAAGHGTAHPRDLGWLPQGDWAGLAPMMFGDYAAPGDLLGFAPHKEYAEEEIYGRCGSGEKPLGSKRVARKNYVDLSTALVPIMERISDFRASDLPQDGTVLERAGWRTFVPVEFGPEGWNILSQASADAAGEDLEYYARMSDRKGAHYNRPPLDIDPVRHFTPRGEVPETVPSASEGHGARVIWVNIDAQEFIDPAICGDVPDMTGTLLGESSRAIVAMIMHATVRGGGDLADAGPLSIAGRWRGDRIVLLGPNGFKARGIPAIDQETVLNTYTDVSGNAAAYIGAEDHFGSDTFETVGEIRDVLSPAESRALTAALKAPAIRAHLEENNPDIYGLISVRIQPGMTVTGPTLKGKSTGASFRIAPRLTLSYDNGVVWLPPEVRREVEKCLAQDAHVCAIQIELDEKGRYPKCRIDVSALTSVSLAGLSAHQRLPLVG
jgi:hypothetical protein